MDRRKFLIGAGSLAAGSAAAMGTGAFTSVSADRTVDVALASDNSAFLQITKARDDSGNVKANAKDYVENLSSGGLKLDLTSTDNGGQGLNKNAETIFDDLFDITNQGTQDVRVYVKNIPSGMSVYSEDGEKGGTLNYNNQTIPSEAPVLSPGDTLEDVGVIVRDPQSVASSDESMTIVATNGLAGPDGDSSDGSGV
ncbi:hypothetical protein [Halorussus aquaticus]|uniref:DUF1102 domain-containing protein n=1 Tax=Halorussus aquaticus TaxID=2953748 RepID=A0ABD5Q556_9EURY|nr:hypothetical protein [Halorussus aquaticus]